MRNGYDEVRKHASDHPLIASWLILFFLFTLAIGLIHECRIGGDVLIVLVRHAKEELSGLGEVARRLGHELTTWDSAEAQKKEKSIKPPPASRGS